VDYTLPKNERTILRELAKRQAEIAALPVMAERAKLWADVNDGVAGARPPFAIEAWTFGRDFMPADLMQCKSALGLQLEYGFRYAIRHHEILNDDHVCPGTIDMGWHVTTDEYGIEIETTTRKDSEGVVTGYHFDCPITDLCDGFDMVKPSTFSVNREETMAHKAFLEETFGDIMPVVIRSGVYGRTSITQRLMRLISMENFFIAMYDCPDKVHGIMTLLRDNAMRQSKWAESEGLLVANTGNLNTCGTCYNFSSDAPGKDAAPGEVKLTDMWAPMDSQETVGVSPELFHELIFPYYKSLAELYGRVYWGCCEPADPIWEDSISSLPNLKAVSISRWANQDYMAEALNNRNIVFSRKPNPNILGVGKELDEDAWRSELRSTLEATAGKNVPVQFVVRDVYTMSGNLAKAGRAVALAKAEIDKFF